MTYTGGCACGAVTLEITGAALAVRQCWCKRCQKMAGGGPAHNAMFKTDDIAIIGPRMKTGYTAQSGTQITWEFCETCGTPLLAYAPVARPHLRSVRLGALDSPHDLAPQAAIWTSEAPGWAHFDPKLPHYPEQPPAPATKD